MLANRVIERSRHRLGWAYLTDDDAFVRPLAMTRRLTEFPPSTGKGHVLGIFGCGSGGACEDGLCGGGGYAAQAQALSALVGTDSSSFVRDQMRNCERCGRWADLALSRIFYERALEVGGLQGLNGWRLKKPCFDEDLAATDHEPLQYHYITTESQMRLLHELFTARTSGREVSLVSQLAREEQCATFRGNEHCASSASAEDLPWDTTADTTCNQR